MYKDWKDSQTQKKIIPMRVSGDKMPIKIVRQYLQWFETGQPAAGTLKVRASHLSLLAGKFPNLLAVTAEDLQHYLADNDWAAQTRKSHRSTLRSFYGWAYRYEHIDKDPSADLRPIRIAQGKPRPAPEARVAEAIAKANPTELVMVLLAAYAGLRRNEIATLRQADVEGNRLRVTGKGNKTRLIPIHPRLAAPLAQQIWQHEGSLWVFPSPVPYLRRQHVSADHVSKTLKRLLGGGHTAHTLRHRFATRAYEGSKDIRAVQELLGHSSPATTAIYTLVDDDELTSTVGMIA
jgi:integrase/recombinase XerC